MAIPKALAILWLAVLPLTACHGVTNVELVCPSVPSEYAKYGPERVITRIYHLPKHAPIFDAAGAQWQDVIQLIKTAIAPGDWQSAFELSGMEHTLIVRTTPTNHLVIGDALPGLFLPP